jgi:DNA polymerase-3 subunit epsilon
VARLATNVGIGAVLDVETTGFSQRSDEIIEFSMTLFRYDRVTGRVVDSVGNYSGLRQPSCPIPRYASEVHGITWHTVKGRRLDYRRIRTMLRQADFVVAHCAAFDRDFVARLMPSFRRVTWLCSRDGIDWWAKGFESRSLEDLVAAHDIRNPCPHRAAADAATGPGPQDIPVRIAQAQRSDSAERPKESLLTRTTPETP